MKPNGLLVAVVILAAIAGGVYWTNKHKADEAKKPSATASDTTKVLSIPEDQFKEIKITRKVPNKEDDTTVVARSGDKWSLTLPKPLPADQDAVTSMVTS